MEVDKGFEITGWRYSMGVRKRFTPEEVKHLRANYPISTAVCNSLFPLGENKKKVGLQLESYFFAPLWCRSIE